GYYCPAGTRYSNEFPCPSGTFGNETGLQNEANCTECPCGYYCDQPAQTTYSKICNAGYYCRSGAASGTPLQGYEADECPAGYYCPMQSCEPQSCPIGTFSSSTRLTDITECLNCTAGYYCGNQSLIAPSGECDAGYYCPGSATTPDFIVCPEGHYCTEGTANPIKCPVGTYSNITGLKNDTECFPCPGGWYCETEGLLEPTGRCDPGYYCPIGSVWSGTPATVCPVGHYCPEGTGPDPIPCKNNSYVNHTQATECYLCPQGYYCVASGQNAICPMGYYCPAGTGLDWQACPRGTYSDQEGNYEEAQCKPCPEGKYCDGEHLAAPSGDCAAGHWCNSGVDREFPNGINQTAPLNNSCYDDRAVGYGGICPVGHYCPTGSVNPEPCPNGTYANVEGLGLCIICPKGYYCPSGAVNYTDYDCPSGHYCPDGTEAWNQYPCAAGKYNNITQRTKVEDCLDCPGGQYCEQTGLTTPTGLCKAGYYCTGGSATDQPPTAYCVAGEYCPEGSHIQTPCDPGWYCATDYLGAMSGQCFGGYYCTSSATMPNPNDGTTGDICPHGAFCPNGTAAPQLCQAGYYLNS
ncbi:unnamed protein product, partial [Owenia fusiformis]